MTQVSSACPVKKAPRKPSQIHKLVHGIRWLARRCFLSGCVISCSRRIFAFLHTEGANGMPDSRMRGTQFAASPQGATHPNCESFSRSTIMGKVLGALAVVLVVILALGFYLQWFAISTTDSGQKTNIEISVDKNKVQEDEEKAKEKARELKEDIKKKIGDQ